MHVIAKKNIFYLKKSFFFSKILFIIISQSSIKKNFQENLKTDKNAKICHGNMFDILTKHLAGMRDCYKKKKNKTRGWKSKIHVI